ncbi:hypothetical protein DRN46_06310 [Thermococci archaeon]|nr:MAG: hypothetical protein DRN46_06310 [Thermococci archaeon]
MFNSSSFLMYLALFLLSFWIMYSMNNRERKKGAARLLKYLPATSSVIGIYLACIYCIDK